MATKTKWYNFEGTVNWAKVFEPDEFRGAKNWTIDFYPKNEAEQKAIIATGIQGKFKEDKDGKSYIRFRRPTQKKIGQKEVIFAPPIIYDANGNVLVKYTNDEGEDVRSYDPGLALKVVGEPLSIGNGTKVVVNVSVYDTAYGPGNRFESLKILELVEYKRQEASDDVESDTAEETVEVDW